MACEEWKSAEVLQWYLFAVEAGVCCYSEKTYFVLREGSDSTEESRV